MLAVKALAFMPICTWYQSKRRRSSPSGRNSLLYPGPGHSSGGKPYDEEERGDYEGPTEAQCSGGVKQRVKSYPDFIGQHFDLENGRDGEVVEIENESEHRRES